MERKLIIRPNSFLPLFSTHFVITLFSVFMLHVLIKFQIFDVRSKFDVFRKIPNTMRKMANRLLDGDSVAQEHNMGTLNTSLNTDLSLLGELQVVQDVLNTVTNVVVFFVFFVNRLLLMY